MSFQMNYSRLASLTCCAGLALLTTAAACAQSSSMGTPSGSTSSTGSTSSRGASSSASLSKSDQNVLQELARANLAEIDLGRLAVAKTQNPQVKNYAQRMVDDHQKALQDVTQFAQAHNVTLPSEPDMKHRDLHKQLDALSGERFDQQYMARSGTAEHRALHGRLLQAQRTVSDADLKALVMRIEPVVDQHMQMAREVNTKAGAASSTGGSGTTGTTGSSSNSPSGTPGRTPREPPPIPSTIRPLPPHQIQVWPAELRPAPWQAGQMSSPVPGEPGLASSPHAREPCVASPGAVALCSFFGSMWILLQGLAVVGL